MLICGTNSEEKISILAKKYVELIENGVHENEIIVTFLNAYKRSLFLNEIKKLNPNLQNKANKILTFYGLCYNAFLDNWDYLSGLISNCNHSEKPNLCGLEVSQYIFKQCIKDGNFSDYISKVNLLHQLFRRYSLIVNNALTKDEIKYRSEILKETFANDVQNAIEDYKKRTIQYRSFDYLRQLAIFPEIYKKTQYFKEVKYFFADDCDEQPYSFWQFVEYLIPSLKDYVLTYDSKGASRCGYLCAYKSGVLNFKKKFNPKEVVLKDNSPFSKFANEFSSNIREGKKTDIKGYKYENSIKRLDSFKSVLDEIVKLKKTGVKDDEIAIISPLCDEVLNSFFKENTKQIKFLTISGNEKLCENQTIKNILNILKLSYEIKLEEYELQSLFSNLLKIPFLQTRKIFQEYLKNNELLPFDFEKDEYAFAYQKLLSIVNSLKKSKSSISENIKVIYTNLIQEFEKNPDLNKYDFLIKEALSFETAFTNSFSSLEKEFIIQIENSVISENPIESFKTHKGCVIISTPQKIIDFSLRTKYQFWLDISSSEWFKEDSGTVYNAWVFNRDWNKEEYTLQDNIELTRDKTARMVRKLAFCAEKEIQFYSSLYDNSGNENFNGLTEFIKKEEQERKIFNITPREDQKPVLNYSKGEMGIMAVPGAGKTTILLALIIKLIKDGISPENIFVLTYMESAAKNFKERIKIALPDMPETPNISTIHGLALRIIKENSNFIKVGLDDNFEICDDTTKERIIKEIFYKLKIEDDKFENYLKCISIVKLSNNNKSLYSKYKDIQDFYNFYKEYVKTLKSNNLIDYDDMLYFAVKILEENKEILRYYQNICKYIIEDEAQDSTDIQQTLIKLLSGKHNNLVRCGDINQSITGTFTNSNIESFKNFLKSSIKVEMNSSQRCSMPIYTLANKLIKNVCEKDKNNKAFYPIEMVETQNNPKNNTPPQFEIFEEDDEEKEFIFNKIQQIVKIEPNATVAILLRLNYQVNEYNEYFNNKGIKTNIRTDCLSQKNIYKIIFSILSIIDNPNNNENIIALAALYQRNNVANILNTDIEFLKKLEVPFVNISETLETEGLLQLFWDINYWLNQATNPMDNLALKIGLYYSKDAIEQSNTYLVSTFIRKLKTENERYSDLLKKLEYAAQKPLSAYKFFEEEIKEDENKINIMTMHKSKGDEFDYVFISQANEDNYPLEIGNVKLKSTGHFVQTIKANVENSKIKTPQEQKNEQIDETLRLLYVGITRAKRELYFTSAKKYKRNKNVKISNFLEELFK